MNVGVYGYLQFNSVLVALEENGNLPTVLKEMGIENFTANEGNVYKQYSISAGEASNILHDLQQFFAKAQVAYPTACLELVDDPSIHCARNV